MSCILLCLLTLNQTPESSALSEEKAILAARKSIRRGHVTFQSILYEHGQSEPLEDSIVNVWFDHDRRRIRHDVTWKKDSNQRKRWLRCKNCEKEGYIAFYGPLDKPGPVTAMTLVPLRESTDRMRDVFLEPRLLGIVSGLSQVQSTEIPFDLILAAPGREKLQCQDAEYQGKKCRKLSYEIQRNPAYREAIEVIILPDQGNHIARISVVPIGLPAGEPVFRDWIESEGQPVGNSGLWFPKVITYEQFVNDKPRRKEIVRVTHASFNEPLDESVFTLAGMDIPEGTPILGEMRDGVREETVWVGGTQKSRRELSLPPPTPASLPTQGTGYYLLAAVLGVAAAGCLGFYLFRWRRSA